MDRSSAGSCAGVVLCPKSFQAIAVLGDDKGKRHAGGAYEMKQAVCLAGHFPLPQVGRRVTDREQASRAGRASRLPRDPLQNPVMTDDRAWGDVRHASEQRAWANEAVESTSGRTLAGKGGR